MAEWECQALADEAKYGYEGETLAPETEAEPRKVVYNSREEVWDFRTDITLPWLSRTSASVDKNCLAGVDKSVLPSSSLGPSSGSKNQNMMLTNNNCTQPLAFKARNFENDFV